MTARDLKHWQPGGQNPFEHNRIVKQRKQYREIARAGRRMMLAIRRSNRTFAALGAAARETAVRIKAMNVSQW
jgi:hypothetical protein